MQEKSEEMLRIGKSAVKNIKGKGKGMSHIRSVRWGVPVRETLVLSHRLCEVGWPVPFLAAFISLVFPPGTHLLLGGQ